jgi:hypothetical protein
MKQCGNAPPWPHGCTRPCYAIESLGKFTQHPTDPTRPSVDGLKRQIGCWPETDRPTKAGRQPKRPRDVDRWAWHMEADPARTAQGRNDPIPTLDQSLAYCGTVVSRRQAKRIRRDGTPR